MSVRGARRLASCTTPRLRWFAVVALSSWVHGGCANVAGLSDLEVVDCVEGDCDASAVADSSGGDADAIVDSIATLDGDTSLPDDVVVEAGDAPLPTDGVSVDVRDAITFDTSGCEVEGELANCGGCGRQCDTTTGVPSCDGVKCAYACKPGRLDCDRNVAVGSNVNGCETDGTTVEACGACAAKCDTATGTPSCAAGKCSYVCATGKLDCDQSGFNVDGCETTKTSPFSCGGCDNVCDTTRSNPDPTTPCDGLKCRYAGCKPGFLNCDTSGVDANGCETAVSVTNCGTCGTQCDTTTGTPSCSGSKCTYACNGTKTDCDQSGTNVNGCESDRTNVNSCGGCAQSCASINAMSVSCDGTRCVYACNTGWTNCQADPKLGGCTCETSATMPGCCGTGCQTKHSNGTGQSYFDCVPVGTLDAAQAEKAKAAWVATQGSPPPSGTATCTIAGVVSKCAIAKYATACGLWCYDASYAGQVNLNTTSGDCHCPGAAIGTSSTWN